MPDQNDTGGARKCSRPARQVQVCGLPLLRALWLNRPRADADLRNDARRTAPEAT
jgi:hypothetical protein